MKGQGPFVVLGSIIDGAKNPAYSRIPQRMGQSRPRNPLKQKCNNYAESGVSTYQSSLVHS